MLQHHGRAPLPGRALPGARHAAGTRVYDTGFVHLRDRVIQSEVFGEAPGLASLYDVALLGVM